MLEVMPIKAFQDNYFWVIASPGHAGCAVVDPGDAAPVEAWLAANDRTLDAILITHHHKDHTGGLAALTERRSIPVYGPHSEKIQGITEPLQDGEQIHCQGRSFRVLAVPGHTLDHIAYFAEASADDPTPRLFCGDTLFSAGCGRIFEGNPAMMYASLQTLASLPDSTAIYPAHEYTLANLDFARRVLPQDEAVERRQKEARALRQADRPTLPTTLAEEKRSNPFLRCHEQGLSQAIAGETGSPQENAGQVFAGLRAWKDRA